MSFEPTQLPAIFPSSNNISLFDPIDRNDSIWFPAAPGRSAVRTPNEVIPYIHGHDAFRDIVAAIRTAKVRGHFIYLLGWYLDVDFYLISETGAPPAGLFVLGEDGRWHKKPNTPVIKQFDKAGRLTFDETSTIRSLFLTATALNVDIRVMLYDHVDRKVRDNSPAVAFINELFNGAAIHDSRVVRGDFLTKVVAAKAYVGVHHQKILIVNGSEGLIAFQGGMDLDPDRLKFGHTRGLHDVHTRVRGVAVVDLWNIFLERWQDHPHSKNWTPIPTNCSDTKPVAGALQVKVGRTYPNTVANPLHQLPPPPRPQGKTIKELRAAISDWSTRDTYQFAPRGEQSAKELVLNAIKRAKRFIYIEDQYLFDLSVSRALKAALSRIDKLIILVERGGDIPQMYRRRRDFIFILTDGKPPPSGKVTICGLKEGYVHSKTMIVDDKCAIIGSANMTRRGYTHDSEQNICVFDTNAKRRFFFAHELRMNLWAKHLGIPPIGLLDPIASSIYWIQERGNVVRYDITMKDSEDPHVPGLLSLYPTDVDTNADDANFADAMWNHGYDRDGS